MALNRTQIITVVLNRAGNRADDTTLVDFAKMELNLAIAELESQPFLPWFLLSNEVTLTITSGDPNVTLPADFLREYEDEDVWYYNADNTPTRVALTKIDVDDLTQLHRGVDANEPTTYALVGNQFVIGPTPSDAAALGSLKTRHFARSTELTDSVLTNPWTLNADFLLVNKLGHVMAEQYLRDQVLAASFEKKFILSYDLLMKTHVAREQANRDAQMGGSDR